MSLWNTLWTRIKKGRAPLAPAPPESPLPVITDDSPEYRDLLLAVDAETHQYLFDAGVAVQIGYTEIFQATKKHILRHKYHLDWRP